jgi:hypothetical protein
MRNVCVGLGLATAALTLVTPAEAQVTPAELNRRCPIPYTVGRQEVLAEAYARVSGAVATGLPVVGTLTNPQLNAMYSNVRSVIAGETMQAWSSVRSQYLCRLLATLPANKHDHAKALIEEAFFFTTVMRGMDWSSPEGTVAALEFRTERLSKPIPTLDEIPAANQITPAEIYAAIGSPNFVSRDETRRSIEAHIGPADLGACSGVIRASLASVDNATLASLGEQHNILVNLISRSTRAVAYSRILTDMQTIFAPVAGNQLTAAVRNAPDRQRLQTCLRKVEEAVVPSTAGASGTETTTPRNNGGAGSQLRPSR